MICSQPDLFPLTDEASEDVEPERHFVTSSPSLFLTSQYPLKSPHSTPTPSMFNSSASTHHISYSTVAMTEPSTTESPVHLLETHNSGLSREISKRPASEYMAPDPASRPAISASLSSNFQPQCKDGVFYNLVAKPDITSTNLVPSENLSTHSVARANPSDELPTYADVADLSPPNYSETIFIASDISEVEFGGLPVGNFALFLISLMIAFLLEFLGLVLAFLLARTHAGRYGAFAGLGLTLIVLNLKVDSQHGSYRIATSLPGVILIAIGSFTFFYCLFAYIRLRILAKNHLMQTAMT